MARFQLTEAQREQVEAISRKYFVRELSLFGSSVTGGFDAERSDLDFAVVFNRPIGIGPADQYFGLLEDLRQLFGRNVDLVSERAVRNRYFREELNETKVRLYAA